MKTFIDREPSMATVIICSVDDPMHSMGSRRPLNECSLTVSFGSTGVMKRSIFLVDVAETIAPGSASFARRPLIFPRLQILGSSS